MKDPDCIDTSTVQLMSIKTSFCNITYYYLFRAESTYTNFVVFHLNIYIKQVTYLPRLLLSTAVFSYSLHRSKGSFLIPSNQQHKTPFYSKVVRLNPRFPFKLLFFNSFFRVQTLLVTLSLYPLLSVSPCQISLYFTIKSVISIHSIKSTDSRSWKIDTFATLCNTKYVNHKPVASVRISCTGAINPDEFRCYARGPDFSREFGANIVTVRATVMHKDCFSLF